MDEKIYLHYTKAELDRNFDQRGWAANALEVIGRYLPRSEATRARLRHRANISYGPSPDETLDIFLAAESPAPVQIFVHGGAWKNFTKDDYSFPADAYVPAGIHTVVLNFTNLPAVRLPEMVAQVRRGFEWVYRNAAGFGGDPDRIFASAHSSGAHLTAMALIEDWPTRGLPKDLVKGATLLSGPYDMEPVMLSARSAYVALTPGEVVAMSPLCHAASIGCPVTIVYAEHDTDEFKRQSREFANALRQAGRLSRFVLLPGVNHFESMESFGNGDGALVREVFAQMGLERTAAGR